MTYLLLQVRISSHVFRDREGHCGGGTVGPVEVRHRAHRPMAPHLGVLDRPVQFPDDMMILILEDKHGALTEGEIGKMDGEVRCIVVLQPPPSRANPVWGGKV